MNGKAIAKTSEKSLKLQKSVTAKGNKIKIKYA